MTFKYKNFMRHLMFAFGIMFITSLNSQTNDKQNFISAKIEIEQMLNGQKPLDYERAVFISENPFYGNKLDYQNFVSAINMHQYFIENLIEKTAKKTTLITHKNPLISKDSSEKLCQNLFANQSIYRYLTDTTLNNIDKIFFLHYPYTYSYDDPLATKNWQYSQVSNLLSDSKQAGNCAALTTLYKILSIRLNSMANICVTQGHIFITHKDENGRTYNVELATRNFPGTGSIEILTHTSDKAVRSGIAMRELNLKQSVALCLINLAKSYEHKYKTKTDKFIIDCAEIALRYDSLNLNAMLLKAEVLENNLLKSNQTYSQLLITKDFEEYEKDISKLYDLGYREMPIDMKNKLIATITMDSTYKAVFIDKTYYPFYKIDNKYKRSVSLSNGLFEEVDLNKSIEKYFKTKFDTKNKKIIAFVPADSLYNNYEFDPVVFALNIDPHFARYPDLSPYTAFTDNPVFFVDPDGRDIVPHKDFIGTRSHTVWLGLVNNTVLNKYVNQYRNNTVHNYLLSTIAAPAEGENGATYMKYYSFGVEYEAASLYNEVSYPNDLKRAMTVIHEAMHASWISANSTLNERTHHEKMAGLTYRSQLIAGTKEFAKTNGIDVSKLTDKDWDDISWEGLESTKAFQKKVGATYDKWGKGVTNYKAEDGNYYYSQKHYEWRKNVDKISNDTSLNLSDKKKEELKTNAPTEKL